jgi:hypothetical protein
VIFAAGITATGFSLRLSVVIPRLLMLASACIGVGFLALLFSPHEYTVWISVIVFLVTQARFTFLFWGNYIYSLPLVIFNTIFLSVGVFSGYHSSRIFVLAAVLAGGSFLVFSEAFVASLVFAVSLLLITFPYHFLTRWRKAFKKIGAYVLVVIPVAIGLSFFCEVLYCYLANLKFSSIFFPEIVVIAFSFLGISNRTQFLFTVCVHSVFLCAKSLSYPFLIEFWKVLIVPPLVHSIITIALRRMVYLIVAMVGFTSLTLGAIVTTPRPVVARLWNSESTALTKWAFANSPPKAVFLFEKPSHSPIVSLAGRAAFFGESEFIRHPYADDVQQARYRQFFMANHLDDDNALGESGVEFAVRYANPYPSAFDSIELLPNWNLTATIGELWIYRRISRPNEAV